MSKNPRPESYSVVQEGVGQRIQWARELLYPVRADIADVMGIDPSTLAKIESGERAPSVFNVLALAEILGVSTDYILRGRLVAHTDPEVAIRLAAEHPQLVLPLEYTQEGGSLAGNRLSALKRPRRRTV